MKKIYIFIVLLNIISCSSPLSKKYNENRFEEDAKAIAKEIDSAKMMLLAGSMMKLKLEGENLEKFTYKEILSKGEKWKKEQQIKEKEQKELAEKARIEAEIKAKKLSESIVVSCYEKGFTKYNYEDYITYKFVIRNKSEKNIRAVKGSLTFYNLFDEEIKSLNLVYDQVIKAKEKITYNATTDYNQFNDSDKALKNKDLKDMKVKWFPEKVIFEDGTSLE